MVTKRAQTSANPNLQQTKNDENSQNISGYEQFREERIKENLERMKKLGLHDLSLQFKSIKPSRKSSPFTRKTPLQFSPLPPSGPTRRSSRLQNTTPVSYSEVKLAKNPLEEEENLLKEEGWRPEIYTEEHEKLLGSTEQSWTLFVDGCGKDGKRIYDSVNGKTCHQCRQKTLGHRTHCSKCNMVQGQFCGDCLYMRYGENVLEAKQNPDWICPVCRGICNCSLCRQAKGWPATGSLYRKISSLGYKSVAHYLIQTRRAKSDPENDLSTKVPLAAKRSLPFVEMETPSSEKESSGLNNPQGLVNPHSDGTILEKNLNEEIEQEIHCSVNEQDNCKQASENTTEHMQKLELVFDSTDDLQGLPNLESESNGTEHVLQNEKEKGIQLLVHNDEDSSSDARKKIEVAQMEAVLKGLPNLESESNRTEHVLQNEKEKGIQLLVHNDEDGFSDAQKKIEAAQMEAVLIEVHNNEDNFIDPLKKSDEAQMKPVLKEFNEDPTKPTPVPKEDKTNSDFRDKRDENICLLETPAPEKTPRSNKRVTTASPSIDSIAGRLRLRRRI